MDSGGSSDNIMDATINQSNLIQSAMQNFTSGEDQVEAFSDEWETIQKTLSENRKSQLRKEELELKKIERKLRMGKELEPSEQDFFDEKGHKVSSIKATEVEVDAVNLLTDIVNGDYTLQDVHMVRDGVEAAEKKDAVENSPLQLFDNIIESVKEQTHEALKTREPGNFFGSFGAELSSKMTSMQMSEAIDQAATAIDLVHGNLVESNEAKEACESYVKALAMNEAESKLKEVEKMTNENQARRSATEKLAEVAAVSGVVSGRADEETSTTEKRPKHLEFEVTDLTFDVSFLPSDDPDVYKPLEIISYIGMTKNVS